MIMGGELSSKKSNSPRWLVPLLLLAPIVVIFAPVLFADRSFAFRDGSHFYHPLFQWIRLVFRAKTIVLANLVIGENVVPEFLQQDCTPEKLSRALRDVIEESPLRRRQTEAFARIDATMSTGDATPSMRAADIVLATMRKAREAG